MQELFTYLDNNVIWNYKNKDKTLIKTVGQEVIIIICMLNMWLDRLGNTRFTLSELINLCGYKVDNHKGKSVHRFKAIIEGLFDVGILNNINNIDLSKIKAHEQIVAKYNLYELEENFFKLDQKTLDKLLSVKCDNKATLVNLYCFLSASAKRFNPLLYNDVTVEYNFNSILDMSKALDISKKTCEKYIDILIDNKIIYVYKLGLLQKEDRGETIYKMANNVYTFDNDKDIVQLVINDFKHYLGRDNWTILDRDISIDKRVINGIKGRITQLQEQGKATKRLENKLKILESKSNAIELTYDEINFIITEDDLIEMFG